METNKSSRSTRNTQRVPRSCTECSRRKIKCSKCIPCTSCVRRGDALSCEREIVRVNGKITVAVDPGYETGSELCSDALALENRSLRERIQELEALLIRRTDSSFGVDQYSNAKVGPSSSEVLDDIQDAFVNLHLGSSMGPRTMNTAYTSPLLPSSVIAILPTQESSENIVRFSLEMFGWVHCALDAPKFLLEHEALWSALASEGIDALQNHSWLALYLSVLAVGVYFMEEKQIVEINFMQVQVADPLLPHPSPSVRGTWHLARAWYDAAFEELNAANYLSKPSICTVQALAILTLVHRNLGEVNREYLLLGLAINLGRTLGMDSLGSEETCPPFLSQWPDWSSRSGRDLGRRLWWTWVICDWMTLFSHPASISPQSFTTRLSIGLDSCSRNIILERPISPVESNPRPSPLEYHIAIAKAAYIMKTHVKDLRQYSMSCAFKALKEFVDLEKKLPSHLIHRPQDALQSQHDQNCPWIPLQRNNLSLFIQTCRIIISISYLPQLLETGEDKFSVYGTGHQAAVNIVDLRRNNHHPSWEKFWSVGVSTLAAGIFLALDLICFRSSKTPREVDKQRRLIEFSVLILEMARSPMSSTHGGPLILKSLLQIESTWVDRLKVDRHTLSNIMRFAANRPRKIEEGELVSTESIVSQDWNMNLSQESVNGFESTNVGHGLFADMFDIGYGRTDVFNSATSDFTNPFVISGCEAQQQNIPPSNLDWAYNHALDQDTAWQAFG